VIGPASCLGSAFFQQWVSATEGGTLEQEIDVLEACVVWGVGCPGASQADGFGKNGVLYQSITVSCGGTFDATGITGVDCSPPPQAIAGSLDYVWNAPVDWMQVFQQPILRTAAATMNDPRTMAGWYGLSAVAGLAMPAAGGVADYSTYVIGRAPDVAAWNGVPFTNVLNMAGWDANANVAWVSEGIVNGNSFTLASPLGQATIDSVFSSEVNQVVWDGAYSITPGGGGYLLLVP
jgi:hypothetical protein